MAQLLDMKRGQTNDLTYEPHGKASEDVTGKTVTAQLQSPRKNDIADHSVTLSESSGTYTGGLYISPSLDEGAYKLKWTIEGTPEEIWWDDVDLQDATTGEITS